MLSIAKKPFILNVFVQNVVMLSVTAPSYFNYLFFGNFKPESFS
jgi:hypothetical protein